MQSLLRVLFGSIGEGILFLFETSVSLCLCSWSCACEWIHGLQVHFLFAAKALWILRSVWLDMIRDASFRLIQSALKGGGKCLNVGLDSDNPCCCFVTLSDNPSCCFVTLRIYGDRSLWYCHIFSSNIVFTVKQTKKELGFFLFF